MSESPSYKGNEDGYPIMAEKAGHDRVGNSSTNKKGKLCHTRYFIIKSLNHHNIQLSIENGIWATQVRNEPILEEAFHVSSHYLTMSCGAFLILMLYREAYACLAEFW